MKVKIDELTGAALDWAVAKAIGESVIIASPTIGMPAKVVTEKFRLPFNPSTNWSQCGSLIDEHGIEFKWVSDATIEAYSYTLSEKRAYEPDHLTAACRLIAMELGEEVGIAGGFVMTQKIYIVEGHFDYEGFNIVGVFSKIEDAEKCEKETEDKEYYHSVCIEEYYLQ